MTTGAKSDDSSVDTSRRSDHQFGRFEGDEKSHRAEAGSRGPDVGWAKNARGGQKNGRTDSDVAKVITVGRIAPERTNRSGKLKPPGGRHSIAPASQKAIQNGAGQACARQAGQPEEDEELDGVGVDIGDSAIDAVNEDVEGMAVDVVGDQLLGNVGVGVDANARKGVGSANQVPQRA